MKPDDDPWQCLDNLPEPRLAPDFARRVIREAHMRRRRSRLRRRLMSAWVFSAALGFVVTAVIRERLTQRIPAASSAVSRPIASSNGSSKPVEALLVSPVERTGHDLMLRGGLRGDSVDASIGKDRGLRKAPLDTAASAGSQTLVLKSAASVEEQASAAPEDSAGADSRQSATLKSAPAVHPERPGAADAPRVQQPAIHLP